MSEFGEFTEVADVSVDVSDIEGCFDDVQIVDDIPEDICYVENEVEISGDALSTDTPMDVGVDFAEQESFDEFIVNEAEENGFLDDISEDVLGDTLSTDIPMDVEVDYSESDSLDSFIVNEAIGNELVDDISEDIPDEVNKCDYQTNGTISENEFGWALDNLSADELSSLRDSIASGDIKVNSDDYFDDGDTGYARVKR